MHYDCLGVGEQKVVWALLPPALLQTQAAHITCRSWLVPAPCSLSFHFRTSPLLELVIELLCSDTSEAVYFMKWLF